MLITEVNITGMNLKIDLSLQFEQISWYEAMNAVKRKNEEESSDLVWRIPSLNDFRFIHTFKYTPFRSVNTFPLLNYWTGDVPEDQPFMEAFIWNSVDGIFSECHITSSNDIGLIMVRDLY